jgi:hypothetical protein
MNRIEVYSNKARKVDRASNADKFYIGLATNGGWAIDDGQDNFGAAGNGGIVDAVAIRLVEG